MSLDSLCKKLSDAEIYFMFGRDDRGWWAHVNGGDAGSPYRLEGRGDSALDALLDAVQQSRAHLIGIRDEARKIFEGVKEKMDRQSAVLTTFELLIEDEP